MMTDRRRQILELGLAALLWLLVGVMGGCHSSSALPSLGRGSSGPDRVRPTGAPEELPVLELGDAFSPEGPGARSPLSSYFMRVREAKRARGKKGQARKLVSVLHLGDSHVASDTITAVLRDELQRELGDAGRGYVYPGKPWRGFRQVDMSYDMGGDWEVHRGMRSDSEGPLGMGGVRLASSKAGDWVSRAAPSGERMDIIDLHFVRVADGGSFRVFIDDQEQATVSTALGRDAQAQREAGYHTLMPPGGAASVKLEVVGDGPVSLLGMTTYKDQTGAVYHSAGINGAQASTFLGFDEAFTISEVARIRPDLMIFAFGTNEAYNLKERELKERHHTDHKQQLTQLIQRYKKGSPESACLVMLPMDLALKPQADACYKQVKVQTRTRRGRRRTRWNKTLDDEVDLMQHPECAWRTPDSLHLIRRAALDAAQANQCAVWDLYTAMGGPGSMRQWALVEPALSRRDGVHLTMDGYRYLGRRLHNDLMDAYRRWARAGDATLRTTPWTPPPSSP